MATAAKRLSSNVPGDFYVDSTCIDCATCRVVAPETFVEAGDFSSVHRQPRTEEETHRALMALVACPTASIGAAPGHDVKAAVAAFPVPVDPAEPAVLYCGFASEKSFGAASYLVVRPEGNVLVDVPRFTTPIVDAIERLGGVKTLFLTHKDDIADQERFHERFRCERVMLRDDFTRGLKDVEVALEGEEPVRLASDLVAIPTPGHTEGSACLLFAGRWLFSGDHLALNPRTGRLYAFRTATWFDCDVQTRSMERLAAFDFEWVLPGHGHRAHFPRERMREEMAACVEWMKKKA
jgi:glyoxylase-like metal-dependent hydrolase (beta-lactamase superfamily II)/ferredoxin